MRSHRTGHGKNTSNGGRGQRRTLQRLITGMIVVALLVSGCSGQPGGQTGANHSPSSDASADRPSPSPEPTADERKVVATANKYAAQYDFDKAIALLEDSTSPLGRKTLAKLQKRKRQLKKWKSTLKVPHLFFHSLIVDPSAAFDHDEDQDGYNEYMVTVKEFKAMLKQLLAKGYVLVNPEDLAHKDNKGIMRGAEIYLPAGKKPLVLSQDDVNYYKYMKRDGFASNLTIGTGGRITNTYVDKHGKTRHGSYDLVPLVDDFIRAHPGFSYRGAKGIIGVTGYNGVLGYRTSKRENPKDPKLPARQRTAKRVAKQLKADGWQFASHTWGHIDVEKSGLPLIKADAQRWNREVRPLVGDTDKLILPFGADLTGRGHYSGAKFRFLKKDGFSYFYNVDASTYAWGQRSRHYYRQTRINVDGIRLEGNIKGYDKSLAPFFSAKKVIDPARPRPVPTS